MSLFLTPDEVAEITDAKRRDVQCQRLAAMGIAFRPSYVGRPLVERASIEAYKGRPAPKRPMPDLDNVKAGKAA